MTAAMIDGFFDALAIAALIYIGSFSIAVYIWRKLP